MKNIKAVIGSGYGDEGKGLMTRYFCLNSNNPIVVLFQGSSNRGATIDKKDFTFQVKHQGSGIFDNVPTFLSPNFIIQPTSLIIELILLNNIGLKPTIYIDKNCHVITPIDKKLDEIRMTYWNQHGVPLNSCCVGSNSCIERFNRTNLQYTIEDFFTKDPIELCNKIYDEWFLQGLTALGVEKMPKEYNKYANNDKGVIDGFYEQIEIFKETIDFIKDYVQIKTFDEIYNQFDTLIFESSVGLLMSSHGKIELNKTASNTGMHDCLEILKPYNEYNGEVCYVTRSYLTKHGAGNFPEENKELKFEDKMNDFNVVQGNLRYGDFYYNEYLDRCREDFKQCDSNWIMSTAITHLNELDHEDKDKFVYLSASKYAEEVMINDNTL